MADLTSPPIEYDPDVVQAAESMIRKYCGWHISPSITETLTLDGKGGSILVLPTMHVTAITAIVADGVTLATSAYTWSGIGMVERLSGYWPRKFRSIDVTLTHGYPAFPDSGYPYELRQFIRQLAGSGVGVAPLTSAQVGQVAVTYGSGTPLWSLLDPYRRLGVA